MGGAALHHLPDGEHLINNFVGLKRALQPFLARGTKAAGHGAAHLAADADGEAIARGDANGLQRETVVCGQQQFEGAVLGEIALQFP